MVNVGASIAWGFIQGLIYYSLYKTGNSQFFPVIILFCSLPTLLFLLLASSLENAILNVVFILIGFELGELGKRIFESFISIVEQIMSGLGLGQ